MTKEEARILVLEDQLINTYFLVDFLHKCLTYENYKYSYPQQTLERLQNIKGIVNIPKLCHHSRHHEDCQSCVERLEYDKKLQEALSLLD